MQSGLSFLGLFTVGETSYRFMSEPSKGTNNSARLLISAGASHRA
jgi:hypothetical protein